MPLLADISVPGSRRNAGRARRPHQHHAGVLLGKRILEGHARQDQHGRDQRPVGERRDAVGGQLVGQGHAADPGDRRHRRARAHVHLEDLDRLAAAVVGGVDGVAAGRAGPQAQAMQQRLLRVERARACGEPGLVVRQRWRGPAPNTFCTVLARVSTRCRPLPGAMPLASIHCEFGTSTRSSPFCTPQMNDSPPDGAQDGCWAALRASRSRHAGDHEQPSQSLALHRVSFCREATNAENPARNSRSCCLHRVVLDARRSRRTRRRRAIPAGARLSRAPCPACAAPEATRLWASTVPKPPGDAPMSAHRSCARRPA